MATTARQQYFADETSLSKEKREFSIADSVQQKIDSIETGAEVNVIEEVKVNGVALVPDANKAVDISVPLVIDSLSSLSTTDALSAKQGKVLYDFIQNIASRGRFLSNWNCATGLPVTNPSTSPYTYMAGDYYTVSTVAAAGGTNYRPDGSSYTIGQASTTVETSAVVVSDMYLYDGTNWVLLSNRQIAVDSSLSTTSTNPVENRVITNALNNKQDALTAGKGINIDTHDVISNTLPGPTVSATAPTNPIQGDMWYDTTDDTLKTYDGTQWNATGGGSSSNTQTFYLSSTSDLTNAQAAYDWYAAGKEPIISLYGCVYTFRAVESGRLIFAGFLSQQNSSSASYIQQDKIYLNHTSGTITSISKVGDAVGGSYLRINQNYGTPYTPQYAGSPSTKKYVDDKITASSTAPSGPTEGMLWYDTTNDVLKTYDGTSWNEISGATYTAGENIQINNGVISATDTNTEYTAGNNITITCPTESDMKGPCPSGFHVPLKDEYLSLKSACITLGITTGTDFKKYLKLPAAGRIEKNGNISGSSLYYLSDATPNMGAHIFWCSDMDRGYIEKANGIVIRPMKNTPVAPDSSWTTLFDGSSVATGAGVFHNVTEGLISISADGTNWTTITDKNLGATDIRNDGDAVTNSNGGSYFQRGNNYPFPHSGATTTSTTPVDASGYGPGNYYSSDVFIIGNDNWSSVNNDNLWGGTTHSTRQDCEHPVISATSSGASYTAGNGINIDSNNEISNTQPGPSVGSTAPQSPSEGDLWYDTTNDVLKSYDGTNWNEIGSGGQNTNMQTFYLAGDQDTTTALAIGNYYISGGNPLIMYKNHVCTLQAAFNGRDDDFLRMYFQCVPFVNQADNGTVGDYETRKRGDVARIFLDFRHITYDAQHNPTAIGYVHEILIETGDSYSNFVKIDNAQTITGAKTFSISPVVPSKTSAATNTGTAVATEAQVYNVASNVNTKTFMLPYDLSSAAAVAVAQEALDWYRAGGNPILYHLGGWEQVPMPRTYYLSHADMPGSSNLLELVFVSQESHVDEQSGEWGGYDDLNFFRIHLLTNSSTTLAAATTVTAVSEDRVTGTSFYVNLRGAQTINGTKTFTTSPVVPNKTADATNTGTAIATEAQVYSVDNKTTKVSATAPSSPTEGMLRYDTTNDILKAYNGTAWKEAGTQMKVLSYGHSTWQDFIDAYNENAIVYCRASSNSNPGSGNQGRMAFMAFIDINSTTGDIQGVEFQYYRSRSSHSTAATVLDEVYIYKLTPASGGTWTVTQRDTAAEPIAGTGIGLTYNASGMTISADTSVLATKTYADDHDTAVSATAPSTATEGMLWYDTTNDVLKTYDGTNWNEVGGGGAGGGGVLRIANARIVNATSPDVTTIRLYLADNTINEGDMVYGVVDDWSYATGTLYQVKLYNSDGTTLLHTCEYLSNNFSPAAADGGVMGMYLKSGNNKYFVNLPCLEYKAGEGIDISDHRDYSAMRGPCSAGFHIPTKNEWNAVNTAGIAMGAWTADDGQWAIEYLFLPPVGYRDFTEGGEIYSGEVTGYYRTCTCNEGVSSDDSYCFKVEDGGFAEIGTEYRSNGYSIRPFKDIPVVPDSSWTRVYPYGTNYGIFHNATLGLVSLSTNGTTWYTLADKNVGATVVYDTLDAHTDANCGKLFQWGNNYGFTGPDNSGGISPTSSTQVNTSAYGPRNYYSSSTFIVSNPGDTDNEDWSTTRNSNLRGGDTGMQYIRNVISASDVVMSGDSGVTYTIRVSNSAPSGASNTTITLVP